MNEEYEQIQISHPPKMGPLDQLKERKFLQKDLVSQACTDATLNH